MTDSWSIASAIATVAAASFAGVQIWLSRRDANNRAVFEHLRDIDARLQAVWHLDIPAVQRELLDYYRHSTSQLSDSVKTYLALLNSLDMLALAVSKGLVTRSATDEYLRTLLQPGMVSQSFLREFQACCGDQFVYEHLYKYFTESRSVQRKAKKSPPLSSRHKGNDDVQ